MGYYDVCLKYQQLSFPVLFEHIQSQDVPSAIESPIQDESRFLALLSPAAEDYLEIMARKAQHLTLRNFGKTIQLYTPMYLSNYCENECAYCGFNAANNVTRRKLSLEEVEKEAAFIASSGLEHILVLTGESREQSPIHYIQDCVRVLKKYFSSISLEIYALAENEYGEMVREGVDGLTLYQETYDENVYEAVHKAGPKKDYRFRLDAPERAARSGMRTVNIGALLGLGDWRKEIFLMGLHAKYLQDRFPDVEIGASIPRLRPHIGDFKNRSLVSDQDIVQIVTALRIFMPRLGITLSTRENPRFRENLFPLGITRMSAGSTTRVGGHVLECAEDLNLPQFEISDTRDVAETKAMLTAKGYQPVLKDWMRL